MCEFHDCNCNGLGDIWWTDKCMYFSSIDVIEYQTVIVELYVIYWNNAFVYMKGYHTCRLDPPMSR